MPDEEKESIAFDDRAPTRDGPRAFSAEQLIACEECLRANPPTRMRCLYCGAPLPSTEATETHRRPTLRPLEEWERGFNVVLLPRGAEEVSAESFAEASRLLRTEREKLQEIVRANCALPLARAASDEEADLIRKRLGALGFGVEIFQDEMLSPTGAPPKRIRALELTGEALSGWANVGEASHSIDWPNIALVVAGRIYTRRVELEERQGRFKARGEIAEARELAVDQAVLDIHAFDGDTDDVWRIMADNFDYSCLGEHKTLLARDNFVTLAEALRGRASAGAFDDDYARLRHLLAVAWPPDERKESHGLRRERPGRFNTEAVTTISNEMQFTRYSRLRALLRRRELSNNT
ncbi:MAG TPA: hypothetical protein VM934_13420 [Pyrinomonadaceae bacterium]|nr:hypothetical protein [Pyrinomonadaceae bacterium]